MRRHALVLIAAAMGCAPRPASTPDTDPPDGVVDLPDLPDPVDPADDTFPWGLPDWAPRPAVPADNPMTVEKVAWGRLLFYDTQLSGNGTQSCASCHFQELGFADGRATSIGSTGESTPRNSMGLLNVAYMSSLTWANPALLDLEHQAMVPIFGEQPIELGVIGNEDTVLARLGADPTHVDLAAAAFPGQPISLPLAVQAVASFVRSMVSFDTPVDRFTAGETDTLPDDVRLGMELFYSERLECLHCHGSWNFSLTVTHAGDTHPQLGFQNNGSYNIGGTGAYPPGNSGLESFTSVSTDMGAFRPPSLRNVALTAPYLHDGSTATLEEVIDAYARGGRLVEDGPFAGDGARSPYKSTFVTGFDLSDDERAGLLAFLRALTDERFNTDPRWSDPRPPE